MSDVTLVTGGCGFIGKHVVHQLKLRGDQVRVLDLQIPEEPTEDVEYVAGDITPHSPPPPYRPAANRRMYDPMHRRKPMLVRPRGNALQPWCNAARSGNRAVDRSGWAAAR